MEIYTSYYDKVLNIDAAPYTLVRVSRTAPPAWFLESFATHVDYSEGLGPSEAILQECPPNENWEVFKPRYIEEVLKKHSPEGLLQDLNRVFRENGERPLLLLCYEPSDLNCHRYLLGDYIGKETKELT